MCLFSRFVFFFFACEPLGFLFVGILFFANVVPDLNFFLENVTLCDTCFKSNGHIAVGSHFLCKHPPKHIHPPFWGKPNAKIAKTPTRFDFFLTLSACTISLSPGATPHRATFFFYVWEGVGAFLARKKLSGGRPNMCVFEKISLHSEPRVPSTTSPLFY